LTTPLIDTLGLIGAALSMLCWVPQACKIIRSKETRAISLMSTLALALAGAVWLAYGIARNDWPLIASSGVSFSTMLLILRLKLRYG
jgi:MtN3 and saliva related transmembrane protein